MNARMLVTPLSMSVVLAMLLTSWMHHGDKGALVVGKDLGHIVIPDEADRVTRFAATELQGIQSITGTQGAGSLRAGCRQRGNRQGFYRLDGQKQDELYPCFRRPPE